MCNTSHPLKNGKSSACVALFGVALFVLQLFSVESHAGMNAGSREIQANPLSPSSGVLAQTQEPDQMKSHRAHDLSTRMDEMKRASDERSRSKRRRSGMSETVTPRSPATVTRRPVAGTPLQIRRPGSKRMLTKPAASGRGPDERSARAFLRSARDLLRIDEPDSELTLSRHQTDLLNHRHLRFSQTYQGMPVWPAELMVHLDPAGEVYLMNGAFVPTPKKASTRPVLTADAAVEQAIAAVRSEMNSKSSAFSPDVSDPSLIIYAPGDKPPRLAWKMDVGVSILSRWLVVIDATTRDLLTAFNQVTDANVRGSGEDLFGVERTLNLWEEGGAYYMADTTQPMYNAAASNPPSPNATYGAIMILDAKNQPRTSEVESIPTVSLVGSYDSDSGWVPDAVSAAHSLTQTYEYYRDRLGRNSIDGKGCSIFGVVRLGSGYANAFWNSETKMMYFGDELPFAGAVDVVAHELTHGVTAHTANLIYWGQSGAMNESFSDIFGEMVESHVTGKDPDWLMGTNLSRAVRNMSDPSSIMIYPGLRYPATMSDFIDTHEDNGGVHYNATILAHAFYQLAAGLDRAIGIQAAEQIFYQVLTYHLVTNSKFVDARLACIASAEELFGKGSSQVLRTAEAFDAIHVFGDEPTSEDPPYIPPVTGDDATLFVYYDDQRGGYYLGRREEGDPDEGSRLSYYPVKPSRPAVSGDGRRAVFVDRNDDLCFIDTGGGVMEDCMGWDDVASVAMSPDESLYGFVFLDETGGEAGNQIAVFDMNAEPVEEGIHIFELVAPTFSEENVTISTIQRADAMAFTSDNKHIVYDALNLIQVEGGSQLEAWSIYAIDLETGQTLVLVPPVSGLQIAFPALSHTSDNFMTFDAYNTDTDQSTLYAVNLMTGDLKDIGTVENWGTPCYAGDDGAIIYSKQNASSPTGYALWRQPMADDRISVAGSSDIFLDDGDYGTIYRRGTYAGPNDTPDDTNGDDQDGDVHLDTGDGGGGCFITTVDFGS